MDIVMSLWHPVSHRKHPKPFWSAGGELYGKDPRSRRGERKADCRSSEIADRAHSLEDYMHSEAFYVIENEWILLQDGTSLAARIWMPDMAEKAPVPAVLEFLPYRKRGGTERRDESNYPHFAAAGIAGVRVDIRGSGESDGVIDGEYTPLELANACEVIAWIAAQPWCNGSVGMMGISWGGFNALMVAALKPPALKAVISHASVVDRYNDDCHSKNGTYLAAEFYWTTVMLGLMSRPPDPAIVGDRWRSMWLNRLENEPYLLEEWLQHKRRDDFWKHGSICENFDDFTVPALVISGWADGYRSTPLKALVGTKGRTKAIIGPWGHLYPHYALPKPRMDYHAEAIAWWNKWLRNEDNGADQLPQMRAFIQDAARPSPFRDVDPGFWIAKDIWETPEMANFSVGPDGALVSGNPGRGRPTNDHYLKSPLATGVMGGGFEVLKPDGEMPRDQNFDDGGSLVLQTAPLESAMEFLGQPVLELDVLTEAEIGNLCARIVDVHPDGTATRVTIGLLNLSHRDGNAEPKAMVKGQKTRIRLTIDAMGYRFRPGHRIRLSLSTAYWPMVIPPPFDKGITINLSTLVLELPKLGTHKVISVPEPADPNPFPPSIELEPGEVRRFFEHDLMSDTTTYTIHEDSGLNERPDSGLASRGIRHEVWSITENDPLSVKATSTVTADLRRVGWNTRTISTANFACTARDWIISASVTAFEDEHQIFEKRFEKTIPRDFM